MSLNKDILGVALYERANEWNDKNPEDYGDINAARLNFWKAMADEVIKHFKENGVLKVPGAGLTAGAVAVTGISVTGTIE